METLIKLDAIDLALTLSIMGCAIALSLWQKLALEGQLFFATARSLIQLLVVAYILEFIFALNNPWLVLFILGIMLTIAAIVARNRIGKKIKNLLPIVWLALFASSSFSLSYIILLVVQPTVWYNPQYLIPLMGMILGNSMNSAALAGERLVKNIENNRQEIETHLCLGATGKQAINFYRIEAIRAGLIPIINQMMVVGLVSLPGMFTGQVLSGISPLDAASYQILILFAIGLTNLIATLLVTEGIYYQFFNRDYQLIS